MNALAKPTKVPARSDRANEYSWIFRVPLHAHAIAENRAAGNRAGGVDRGDSDSASLLAKPIDERVDQRRFAGAWRPGEADDRCLAG